MPLCVCAHAHGHLQLKLKKKIEKLKKRVWGQEDKRTDGGRKHLLPYKLSVSEGESLSPAHRWRDTSASLTVNNSSRNIATTVATSLRQTNNIAFCYVDAWGQQHHRQVEYRMHASESETWDTFIYFSVLEIIFYHSSIQVPQKDEEKKKMAIKSSFRQGQRSKGSRQVWSLINFEIWPRYHQRNFKHINISIREEASDVMIHLKRKEKVR